MSKAILSVKYPQYAQRLRELGYEIIPTEEIPCQMSYERDHADLQCLILDDTAFVLNGCNQIIRALSQDYHIVECGKSFGAEYPKNVGLSAIKLGKKLVCRTQSLDDQIKEYCNKKGYELIHVNQGYAKCSCAVVSDNAIITADRGISRTLSETKIEVLTIGEGYIKLDGANHGFIGGASGYDKKNRTLFFCGDIELHPNYQMIRNFCDKHQTAIICLSEDELKDIGGILIC